MSFIWTKVRRFNEGTKSLEAITKASNKFSRKFYEECAKSSRGNFLISPLAAETSLIFLLATCKSAAAIEILRCSFLPDKERTLNLGIKKLFSLLESYDDLTVTPTSKIFVTENSPVETTFCEMSNDVYHVEIENVNFDKIYHAAKKLSEWVHNQTRCELVDVDCFNMTYNMSMFLLNTLYFKARWLNPFSQPNTRISYFYKSEKILLPVETMFCYEQQFNYSESFRLNAKILELPFYGKQGSMIIVLPNQIDGLPHLEKKIGKIFSSLRLKTYLVTVSVPKFKICNTIDLKEKLKNMGINKIFNKKEALISKITNENDVFFNEMTQTSVFDMSEDGVHTLETATLSLPKNQKIKRPKTFIADHPFIYYIKVNNVIILVGRVLEPDQS